MGDNEAAPGHSREEGTLEWQLMQARSQMVSMLHHPLPASAILHPLYAAPLEASHPTRASFQRHLQHLRASVRRFIDEATTASIVAQQDEEGQLKHEAQADLKAKKQRIISLLRENSSHSTAISAAASQLQRPSRWDTMLSNCSDTVASEKRAEAKPLEEARKQIQQFIQTCETMAKDLKMEAFAEEHKTSAEDKKIHTHTLTLAASIIVVDVEVCLEVQSDSGWWNPLIRLRLSYATDSTTTKPVVRDQSLADCLEMDFQAVADALLGCEEGSVEPGIDAISPMTQHQARAKKTLQTLKRLDDISIRLSKVCKESPTPDLFAALDAVGKSLQATRQASPPSVEEISDGGGLLQQHVGLPYTSIVYHADKGPALAAVSDIAAEMNRITLTLVDEKPRLHFVSITVTRSTLRVVQADTPSNALPNIDDEAADGITLLYTAELHPPVVMPQDTARKLCMIAGVALEQEGAKSRKKATTGLPILVLSDAPSYEDMMSASNRLLPEDNNKLQYASKYGFGRDAGRQGVTVTHFPFASLQHLNEAVVILRQQVHLNELLRCVSPSSNLSTEEEKEMTMQDILFESKEDHNSVSSRVSLAVEESGICSILINVPLEIDIWTLEVKVFTEKEHWAIYARACKLGQEQRQFSLERTNCIYKESVALLGQRGGKGLQQVLTELKTWALDQINGDGVKKSRVGAPAEVEETIDGDLLGPLPDVEKISPAREIRESRTKGRRGSVTDSGTSDASRVGTTTRRMSNAQSPVADTLRRSTSVKRRASQAGIEDDDGQKRASRKKN